MCRYASSVFWHPALISPSGVLELEKMRFGLLLISTSAASALWTGPRRLRAISGGTLSLGGPPILANSHPLAIPRGGQLGDSLAHECGEAAAYGFVYAIAAALTGGVAERIFPDYNDERQGLPHVRPRVEDESLHQVPHRFREHAQHLRPALNPLGTNGRGSGKHPPAREKNWSSAARNKYPSCINTITNPPRTAPPSS